MTKEEIIEMAKQAGFERLGVYAQFGDDWVGFTKDLETFAKLVAEKEREECAEICDGLYHNWINLPNRHEFIMSEGASECAGSIREKGQE
jgi:hypothetical protein